MARRCIEPSTMSLLGLVRHLAEVERATFRVLMAGQDAPRLYCSEIDRDGDFDGAVPTPGGCGGLASVADEGGLRHAAVAEAPGLDIIAHDPLNRHGGGGGPMSLREVLVGTIDEYARHVGHVDLLRERIDERIGQSSPARETADGVGHRDGPDTVVRAVGVDGHGSGRDG